MTQIVLHQWAFSPFCTKVRKMMDYKGIEYTTKNYNGFLALEAKRLSKTGKLPVLEVDGEMIQDSRVIARYLDTHFPEKPLTPSDPTQVSKAEIFQDWADESLYFYEIYFRTKYTKAMFKVGDLLGEGRPFYEKYFLGPALGYQLGKAIKQQGIARNSKALVEERFLHLMDQVDRQLEASPWLAGDAPSIADFALAGQLIEVVRTGHLNPQLQTLPHLWAWINKMQDLPCHEKR